MEAKMINDAAAYIRSLAEMRGRNAVWAERAVREGASLAVNEALEKNVIDVVAPDINDLLRKIDGRQVAIGDEQVVLKTAGLKIETIDPNWRIQLLSIITNPNIAFILILVGVYGLFFEFANPGSIGPGVVGLICLLLGLYALNVLPLNYAGLGLLIFAIALMAAEVFVRHLAYWVSAASSHSCWRQ
jgi:membrane-bound serine protease (ClpP class)